MKSCALAARAAAIISASRRIGPAEAQVVLDRAVEQVGVLGDDRDHPAHLIRVERADVVSANADRAGLGVVLAQQQAEDRGFAGAARADDANRLTGRDREAQPAMGVAAPAWIGEPDSLEGDASAWDPAGAARRRPVRRSLPPAARERRRPPTGRSCPDAARSADRAAAEKSPCRPSG